MRVLCIDWHGSDGMLDFCMRVKRAGHEVRWHFHKTDRNKINGKGLVEAVDDWRDWGRWADVIVLADNTKYLREIDVWRRERGVPVIGATCESAAWELNRTLGQQVLRRAGIPTLPFREFKSYDDAIAYVKKEMRRFVSKPIGDEPDKALSYVAKSPADMVYMLTRWKKAKKLKGDFILQEFCGGTEMAVGAFVGRHGFLPGWFENWEEKNLMAGGTGPATGEMGTVVRCVQRSKLASKVLAPLEKAIIRTGHTGYIDVNCIIDENGTPWPLEFTTRFGWPTFNIQQALIEGDPVEWLADLADGRGEPPKPRFVNNRVAVGVVMAIPDFPYSHATAKEVVGIPVYGISPGVLEKISPCQMMMGSAAQEVAGKVIEMPCLVTAGDYVLVATGTGETVRDAREAAHRLLKRLKAPSSPFWRPDIGARLKKQLPSIQAMGYAATPMMAY